MDSPPCKLRKKHDEEPLPLWQISLDMVLRQVADEHPETLVRMIARDSKLRNLMTEELLRKPHPVAQLGDSDLIEVYRICMDVGDHPKIYPMHHDEFFMKVGDLPWRLRLALKHEYDMNAGALSHPTPDPERLPSHGELYFSKDGRIVFEIEKDTMSPCHATWLENAYLRIVRGFIEEHDVPSWEDVQGAKWDEIDIQDRFPHVVKDTLEDDAYLMQINYDNIRKRIRREIRRAFVNKKIVASAVTEGQECVIPIRQAWVRKPKVRVWVPITYNAPED